MSETITIEALEQLATQLEATDREQRAKLQRLIAAYARIIALREPGQLKRRPVEVADEDGHWDGSYPPNIQYKDYSGPRLIEVRRGDYDTVATEGGCYHAWRAVTSDCGVYVASDGGLYGRQYSGEGRVGQYAAHPGNCDVRIEVTYDELDTDEIALSDLTVAESTLRDLAFPLGAAAQAAE